MAGAKRRPGHIASFLKRADKAVDDAINQGVARADEILDDAVELGKVAASEAQKKSTAIKKRAGVEKASLRKMGREKIARGVDAAKRMSGGPQADLDVLERLGKLRKAGIITEREFQEKKKKILGRI